MAILAREREEIEVGRRDPSADPVADRRDEDGNRVPQVAIEDRDPVDPEVLRRFGRALPFAGRYSGGNLLDSARHGTSIVPPVSE